MFCVLPALAIGLALGAGAAASAPPAGDEVEWVVAVIRSPGAAEPRVVTASEVEEEARVALVSRGAVLAATQPLDGAALKAGLEHLVDEVLLDEEARRLHVFEIDREDGAAEVARFRALFARRSDYERFLARCDLPEAGLEALLRRMLRVRRYVESRVSHAAEASEAEVSAWLDRHAAELGVRDRQAARAHLAAERTKDEVKALVRDLRARAEVRLVGGLEARTAPVARPGVN